MLISFILQFEKYEIECSEIESKKYFDLVDWWNGMNTNERHLCFTRFENRGLSLNFKYDALSSYLKIYENELNINGNAKKINNNPNTTG